MILSGCTGKTVSGDCRWKLRSCVHVKASGYACFCNNGRSSRILPTRSSSSTRSISCADCVATQHRHEQIAAFGDHLVARHRIVGGAAHVAHVLVEHRAVGQRDTRRSPRAPGASSSWSGTSSTLARCAQHRGVAHARDVVRGLERDGAVDQHHGDHVLQADVGDVAVVHHRGFAGAEPHAHLSHLLGVERPPFQQDLQRVERRLDRRADRPFLDVGADDLVALAELLDRAAPDRRWARWPG